jgi:glycogen(starch) synthase
LVIDPDWYSGRSAMIQFFVGRRSRERQAVAHLHWLVAEFAPDVVFAWDTTGLPKPMLAEAEDLPETVMAYYLAAYQPEVPDEYVAFWQVPPRHWVAKWTKLPLAKVALSILKCEGKPITLRYENVACVSDYLRRRMVSRGLISANAVVIYNGLDLSHFSAARHAARTFSSEPLKCLVAGRMVPDKGIHSVIEALGLLHKGAALDGMSLTILGDGPADYMDLLKGLVAKEHVQASVAFRQPVPREQMPEVLTGYDVLLLPSEYAEPLARAIQEAMAVGLLVIGTTTGGSSELLVHEETGLVFEAGNPESLAAQLVRAKTDPQLAATLAENGRQAVAQNFDIQRTVAEVEHYLLGLVAGQ